MKHHHCHNRHSNTGMVHEVITSSLAKLRSWHPMMTPSSIINFGARAEGGPTKETGVLSLWAAKPKMPLSRQIFDVSNEYPPPLLPPSHILSRHSTWGFDTRTIPLDMITCRICDFFRRESIAVRYPDRTSTTGALAYGTTPEDLVEFSIQLWSTGTTATLGKGPPRNCPTAILVEIRRIRGDGLFYYRCQRSLYHYITTGASEVERMCTLLPLPETIDREICADDTASDAIQICLRLLQGTASEHRLGLESLVALTDGSTTIESEVQRTCRFVVKAAGQPGKMTPVQSIFKEHIVDTLKSKNLSRHFNKTNHILTLKIITHSLEATVGDAGMTLEWKCPFWHMVLDILQKRLHSYQEQPLEASLSIRCLRAFRQVSPELVDESMIGLLRCAHREGRLCHLALERESEWLLEDLGAV